MDLHEKIRTLRKSSGMSQEQLAEKLNVSRQSVSKWESGLTIPEVQKIIQMSTLYNVSLDYLLNSNKNDFSKSQTTSSKSNTKKIIGILMIATSIVIVFSIWILSIIYPSNYSTHNYSYMPFTAFIYSKNIFLLYILCSGLIISGLILLTFKNMIIKNKVGSIISLIGLSGILSSLLLPESIISNEKAKELFIYPQLNDYSYIRIPFNIAFLISSVFLIVGLIISFIRFYRKRNNDIN